MKNVIFWSNFSSVYFPGVYIRGDLCYRVMYHIHSSRQQRPECVHVVVCAYAELCWRVSPVRHQHTKPQKGPGFACAMPWGSAVSAHCGWGSSEAFLGRAASSGLCSGFGGDAAYFPCVLWDNLTQTRLPSAAHGNCFAPHKKAASSLCRSANPMDPSSPGVSFVLALCAVTLLLFSGRPCTTVPSFSCAKHQ